MDSIFYATFAPVNEDRERFVHALADFVRAELAMSGEPADYLGEALQIVDARMCCFKNVGLRGIDEEAGIYPLRSLCRLDEESFELIPDEGRIDSLARYYF